MSIVLITGSMFSEKTTTLLSYARKYRLAKKKVILIKHGADDRYSPTNISSHNQDYLESTFSVRTLEEIKNTPEIQTCDVVLIDEGQFFTDVGDISAYWAGQGKHIIISALNGTFDRKPFPAISCLIPYVNRIVHLSAVCTVCGQDAHFSHLKIPPGHPSDPIIGGTETYEARCRPCLNRS
jgi:thymidine kinase